MKELSYHILKSYFPSGHKNLTPRLFIILLFSVLFSYCTKKIEFTIGEDFTESQTRITIIDTFKLDVSTILLDSISTSGKELLLLGNSRDSVFGLIKSSSYFNVSFPASSNVENNAVFDSAVFCLKYSGYSYGDTTTSLFLGIHKLKEKIVLNDDKYLYNSSEFEYFPEMIGYKSFTPRPNSSDSVIYITVNEYGKEIFDLFKARDERMRSTELFLDYMKGFYISSDIADNGSIIAFTANSESLSFQIHYHYIKEDQEDYIITIPMGESAYQFNNIQNDFSGTGLENFKSGSDEFLTSETGNTAYMQVLSCLMPKIQFPTLQNLLLNSRWKILSAELIFKPVKESYDLFKLPQSLYLYDTDKHNSINKVLTNSDGASIVPTFHSDPFFDEDTYYSCDITDFILNEFSDAYFDNEHGILIGLDADLNTTTFERLLIEDNNPSIKLRIHYLSY